MKLRSLLLSLCAGSMALSVGHGGLPTNWKTGTNTAAPTPTPKNFGEEYTGEALYTKPDFSSSGGIHFVSPVPLKAAYAIPENNQNFVYKGQINGNQVSFQGLPSAKYDLMLQTERRVYEGIVLNRDEDNLTRKDIQSINVTVGQNIPFFDLKHIHRIKGTTGQAGKATAVTQEVRTGRTGQIMNQNADILKGFQIRSIKVQFIEDVGVAGWQVRNTREIIRQSVHPEMQPKDVMPIDYGEDLGNIRVTDSVKDLGTIKLPEHK